MTLTKGDKIIISIVLFINLLSIPILFAQQKTGDNVIVEAINKFTEKYSLKKEQSISVEGKLGITEIAIKNGKVRITRSPCLHKVCIKMGWIQQTGEIAVCIPNQVLVRVVSDKQNGLDAIVG